MNVALVLPVGVRTVRVDVRTDAMAIAIVGPSGIGKTTLLRAIAGLLPEATGRIEIGGRVLHDDASGLRAPPSARDLGWVPQEALLFPHLSVRQNVAFGARGGIDAAVAVAGISPLLDRSPTTLSGGERQRVALARALAAAPRALLLDEPLSALDRAARAELASAIVEHCARQGTARIVVSHDESDLGALASERFTMDERGIASS